MEVDAVPRVLPFITSLLITAEMHLTVVLVLIVARTSKLAF
jgi:hypothetical protein